MKLREVLEWNLPQLTLEMCKSVKEDVESIDQFTTDLREAVRLEAAEELQVRHPYCSTQSDCLLASVNHTIRTMLPAWHAMSCFILQAGSFVVQASVATTRGCFVPDHWLHKKVETSCTRHFDVANLCLLRDALSRSDPAGFS